MAEGSLVVADNGIVPIRDIEGAVRAGLDIDRAEALVVGAPEGREELALVAGPVGGHPEAVHDVRKIAGDDDVALEVVGQGGRVDDLAHHALDAGASDVEGAVAVLGVHHHGEELAQFGAIALHEGLAPLPEGGAPGVLPAAASEGVQLEAPGTKTPDSVLIHPHDPPGGLDPGKAVQALAEEKLAARAPREGVDVLVGVAGAEAAQDHLARVGPPVAVGVC